MYHARDDTAGDAELVATPFPVTLRRDWIATRCQRSSVAAELFLLSWVDAVRGGYLEYRFRRSSGALEPGCLLQPSLELSLTRLESESQPLLTAAAFSCLPGKQVKGLWISQPYDTPESNLFITSACFSPLAPLSLIIQAILGAQHDANAPADTFRSFWPFSLTISGLHGVDPGRL